VINSNLGTISHHLWNTATYQLEKAHSSYLTSVLSQIYKCSPCTKSLKFCKRRGVIQPGKLIMECFLTVYNLLFSYKTCIFTDDRQMTHRINDSRPNSRSKMESITVYYLLALFSADRCLVQIQIPDQESTCTTNTAIFNRSRWRYAPCADKEAKKIWWCAVCMLISVFFDIICTA